MSDIAVKELRWADEQPGQRGQIRTQEDGQIEFFTNCGRYIIRIRESVVPGAPDMFVARYLTNHILGADTTLKEARARAQADHETRIRSEIADIRMEPSGE